MKPKPDRLLAGRLRARIVQSGPHDRPDRLVIADDNLLTAASEGIAAADVRVPRDLDVVAATNFPNLLRSPVPVTRIGFDIPALLDLLVLRLEQVGRGETPPENTALPAGRLRRHAPGAARRVRRRRR